MSAIVAGQNGPEPPEWMKWLIALYIHVSIALFSMWWITELLGWVMG